MAPIVVRSITNHWPAMPMMVMMVNATYDSSGHSHRTAKTVLRIERCTAQSTTLVCAPACFACPNRVVEPVQAGLADAVGERCVAHEWDVVEAEIP